MYDGSFELEGKERTLAIGPLPSLDARHPGRELVFVATPIGTDRDAAATGKPRTAERYRVRGLPGSKPAELDPPPALTPVIARFDTPGVTGCPSVVVAGVADATTVTTTPVCGVR